VKPEAQLARDQKSLLKIQTRTMSFGLALVSAKEIRSLNCDYRGKDKPTDVLSFPAPKPQFLKSHPELKFYRGEVVICLAVAKKQACEHGHALKDELRVLLVHGFLHLLGYDHEISPREAERMRREEAKLLKKLKWSTEPQAQGLISRADSRKPKR